LTHEAGHHVRRQMTNTRYFRAWEDVFAEYKVWAGRNPMLDFRDGPIPTKSQVDGAINSWMRSNPEAARQIKRRTSGYATEGADEWFAEMYSEGVANRKPNRLASRLAKHIDDNDNFPAARNLHLVREGVAPIVISDGNMKFQVIQVWRDILTTGGRSVQSFVDRNVKANWDRFRQWYREFRGTNLNKSVRSQAVIAKLLEDFDNDHPMIESIARGARGELEELDLDLENHVDPWFFSNQAPPKLKEDIRIFYDYWDHTWGRATRPTLMVSSSTHGYPLWYRYGSGEISIERNVALNWDTFGDAIGKGYRTGHFSSGGEHSGLYAMMHESGHFVQETMTERHYTMFWNDIIDKNKWIVTPEGFEIELAGGQGSLVLRGSQVDNIITEWMQDPGIVRAVRERVSGYATENANEWFAEMWAEAMTARHPKGLAKQLRSFIERNPDALRNTADVNFQVIR